jgi:hypothetical protein
LLIQNLMRSKQHSKEYLYAMRPKFVKDVLNALKNIQPFACTAGAAMYVDIILTQIRDMESYIPYDSIMEVLRALYDALVYKNNWLKYESGQFQKVLEMLSPLTELFPLTSGEVNRAILKLREFGFDILPYEIDIAIEEEADSI